VISVEVGLQAGLPPFEKGGIGALLSKIIQIWKSHLGKTAV
jgi:hypothetical protein